jgi:hypothetical protein
LMASWRSMMKIEGTASGSESGSISQRHGSVDPDPHKNVMDPQHWFLAFTFSKLVISNRHFRWWKFFSDTKLIKNVWCVSCFRLLILHQFEASHKGRGSRNVYCSICDMKYKTNQGLYSHIQKKHPHVQKKNPRKWKFCISVSIGLSPTRNLIEMGSFFELNISFVRKFQKTVNVDRKKYSEYYNNKQSNPIFWKIVSSSPSNFL